MAVLTTVAILKAHDQMSGTLKAAAANARKFTGTWASGATAFAAAGRSSGLAGVAGAMGINAMYEQARKFEEKITGVGISTIPNTIRAGGDAAVQAAVAMQAARIAAMGLSKELALDPVVAAEIQETLAKAGVQAEHVAQMSRSVGLIKLTDKNANVEQVGDWAASLSTLYANYMKLNNIDPAQFFKKAADAAAIGAAETALSTGTFLEGMKQFSALTTQYGMSPQQNAALMAASKKASGDNHIELGQTVKTIALRMTAPTAQNLEAFNRLGLNRRDYFEGGTGGSVSAAQATSALAAMTQGKLRGKERAFFLNQIDKMGRTTMTDERRQAWDGAMQDRLGKVLGLDMKQDANRERVTRMLESSLVAGAGTINFEKLFSDLAERKDKDPTAVVGAFEKRRGHLVLGILNAFKKDEGGGTIYKQLLESIQKSDGRMLDDALKTFNASPYGRMMAMESALKRFTVTLAGSSAATAVLTQLADGLQRLDQINPSALNAGVKLGLIGLAAGPLLMAAKGLRAVGLAGGMAVAALGRLAALPFLKLGAWFTGLGSAMTAVGAAGLATAAGGLGSMVGALGKLVRFGTIGLVGGGLLAMILGPESAMKAFDKFTKDSAMTGLVAAGKSLLDTVDQTLRKTLELFGIDGKSSGLITTLEFLVSMLTKAVELIDRFIDPSKDRTTKQDHWGTSVKDESWLPNADMPTGEWLKRWWAGTLPNSLPARDKDTSPTAEAIGAAVAKAMQGAPLQVNVNGGSGSRPAVAAEPSVANGGQYGRK